MNQTLKIINLKIYENKKNKKNKIEKGKKEEERIINY